jgi:DNA topoisomerase-3
MGKALIIAEKPSVAADIARVLGGFAKQGDYFENDEYVLSSAVGHLVEIAAPEQYEVKRGKWSFAHLPVIPPEFDLKPIEKSADRLKLLTRLIRRKDVDALINACDAGREGELIFRLIVQHAKAKQPIRRLWLQSMTPGAIREGFARLREDTQMLPLADAARCRSEADWLVGINGTRAMTAFNSRDGGFYLTTVGRVQTPTLAIVVEREERIRKFQPRAYFEVKATFGAKAGDYEGRWFDPAFQRNPADADLRPERIWDEAKARAIVEACRGRPGTVTEESKPSTQAAPALFDLTSLQREANGRFGFSAKTTLSLAQALYEKHKVLTYPRTDSKALPEDYVGTVRQTMDMLSDVPPYGQFSRQVLKNDWIRPGNKRIFDNSKISDHFAIIPTLQPPKVLSDAEQKVYDLVVKRFLAVFFPSAEYRVTTRITTVGSHAFKTEGKVLVSAGWLAIYGREAVEAKPAAGRDGEEAASGTLVAVEPDEVVRTDAIEAIALATRPPARFNEATLLSAMEGAGKLVDDEELREAMAAKGLGTPATRAQVIEGLINESYLVREGRDLIPTAKAFQLLTLLRGLGVAELTMPELTGEWEYKLAQMERGRLDRDAFMREIAEMTEHIVARAKGYGPTDVPGDYATLREPCPKCGGVAKENYRRFACTACDWSITKSPSSRLLEPTEAELLMRDKVIGPLHGFRSKMGRPFSAMLKLASPDWKLEFDFGQSDSAEDDEPVDFSGQEPVGACPRCRSNVFEHGMSYVCEKSVGAGRTCDFRSGKVILQQPVERAQMAKLLAGGRTDLLDGFVSSRTRRRFKAFLVRQPDGKVGFEFQASAPRPGAKPAADAPAGQPAAPGADGRAGAARSAAVRSGAVRAAAGAAPPARAAVPGTPAPKRATPGRAISKAGTSKTAGAKTAGAKTAGAKTAATGTAASKAGSTSRTTAPPRTRKAG